MAERLTLSNDASTGYKFDDHVLTYAFDRDTSAHGNSAAGVLVAQALNNGIVKEFAIGVVKPAVSASGFITADVTAQLRINSAACLSTQPSITGPVASTSLAVKKATNAGGGVSAVVNSASAAFSTGDFITIDYDAKSAGSAAAGQAGVGFFAVIRVRYSAA